MHYSKLKIPLFFIISIFSFNILEAKCVVKYTCGGQYCYALLDGSCSDYSFTSNVVACTDLEQSIFDPGGNPNGQAEVDIHEWACGQDIRTLSVDTNGYLIYYDGTARDTLHDLKQTIYNPSSDSLLIIGDESGIAVCGTNKPSLELELELASEYIGTIFSEEDERISEPSSIENLEVQKELVSIFPNPTSGTFSLRLNSSASYFLKSANARFKVMDLSGKTIINTELKISSNELEISLPKDLKPGYYFYKFEGGITQEGRIQLVK